MNILFVDDEKERAEKFFKLLSGIDADVHWAKSVDEAKRALTTPFKFDWIFLDFDLGVGDFFDIHREGTGLEVAKFIRENVTYPLFRKIVLHSFSEEGARLQWHVLDEFRPIIAPFGTGIFESIVKGRVMGLIPPRSKHYG